MTLEAYRERVARQKRAATLAAALRLFLNKGYDGTSIEAVAKEAGISSATVYKHFRTKAALFGAIVEAFWQDDEDAAASAAPPPGDPRAGLARIGRTYAGLLTRPDVAPLFRVIIAEAPRFPELGVTLYERGKKPYLDRLAAYVRAEVAAGTLAVPDVDLAVRQFLGMINDVVFWPRLLLPELRIPPEEAARVVDEAVATFLARYGAAA